MAEPLVNAQTPLEFFKERVEAACDRQRLTATLTSYYVVSLLAEFTRLGRLRILLRQPSTPIGGRGLYVRWAATPMSRWAGATTSWRRSSLSCPRNS